MSDRLSDSALGERLRLARTSSGLTQARAAKEIGVARTTMVALEHGERPARPQELLKLARLYGVSANSLMRRGAVQLEFTPQFRKLKNASEDDQISATRQLQRLASGYVELERRLGLPLRPSYPAEQPIRRQDTQQAADLALSLRQQLGLGLGPIPGVVCALQELLALRVFVRPLPPAISEVFGYQDDVGACFLLNANHTRERRSWSIAHGVGHLLTTRNSSEVCSSSRSNALSERFADAFAAEFLMPGAAIRSAFEEISGQQGKFSTRHLIHMAHSRHVSREAMARRLEQLGLLKPGTFDALKAKNALSRKAVAEVLGPEAVVKQAETPTRFSLLAVEGYAAGLLSEGQLAELLGVDRLEARYVIDALGGESVEELAL